MKEFLSFLQENWRFIAESLLTVLSIILVIVFRKKIKLSSSGTMYEILVDSINKAEALYGDGHGDAKLSYVLTNVSSWLIGQGFTKECISDLLPGLADLVEKILSTPQKKEVL